MSKDQDKIFKKKVEFLMNAEEELSKKVAISENKLVLRILENLIDKLDIKDGIVESNSKNIKLTLTIDKIIKDFNKTISFDLIKGYIKDINKGSNSNKSFFGSFKESDGLDFDKITKKVNQETLKRLGIDSKGNVIKGGFIDEFSRNNQLNLKLKDLVTQGVTGRMSLVQLKKEIKGLVSGSSLRKGALNAEYNTFIYDTYSQIDRLQSNLYAQQLGLKAFRYAGGKIKTTRKFCCQRNNLVFTTDEAKKWSSISFSGKSSPYNPLIDLGGYNCRHFLQFMSNVRATNIRGDLRINDKRDLIKDSSGKKQTLNQGC